MSHLHNSGRPYLESGGFFFHPNTNPAVVRAIVAAHARGERVRLFYGDTKTGVAWAEENDVSGRIGRSMGAGKIALIVAPRAHGGPGMLEHCIVGILTSSGWSYRHNSLSFGTWEPCAPVSPGYTEAVRHNGTLHAQFKGKPGRAARYIAFMTGGRLAA